MEQGNMFVRLVSPGQVTTLRQQQQAMYPLLSSPVPLQSQTITLPSNLSLAPGTVLTLQNGQILKIEPAVVTASGGADPETSHVAPDIDTTHADTANTLLEPEDASLPKRRPGRPKSEPYTRFEKPAGNGPYPCHVCNMMFESWSLCKKHIKKHDLDRRLKCDQCDVSFNLERNLKLHQATHQTGDTFACPECSKKFQRMASLKCHLAIHEEEDNVICSICGDEFETDRLLESHLAVKHMKEERKYESPVVKNGMMSILQPRKQEPTHVCKTCDKGFITMKGLREHQLKHRKLKSSLELLRKRNKERREGKLSCGYCDKKFFKPSQVIRHERIHTGVKPFKCPDCDKSFTQKQSMESHARLHTGHKPYACSFCSQKFSQRGNLRAHIVKLHNIDDEDKFKCTQCTCSFRKLGSLNAHYAKMHQDELKPVPDLPKQEWLDFKDDHDNPDDPGEDDLLSKAISSTISAEDVGGTSRSGQVVVADSNK